MLKQVVLTRRRAGYLAQLAERRKQGEALDERSKQMQQREAELEAAVNETDENTSAEDRAELDAAVEEFETERQQLETEQQQLGEQLRELEQQIADIDKELDELNKRMATVPAPAPEPEKRKDDAPMSTRRKFFGMTLQERDAFLARQDIKDFLQRFRDLARQKRTITGAELTIPEAGLELLRDLIIEYSRLAGRVNLRRVPGKARQRIAGAVPEGVWTEMCAKLNELEISFNELEVDGYKVGGYIAICNAILEDSDIALATEIFSALGQSIGMALDKAMVYGTGVKMPVGIATRIAETEQPDYYGVNEPAWKDISTTNVITIPSSSTGTKLFKELALAAGKARSRYATGGRMWIMTETTHLNLMAEAIGTNAAGAIVSGVQSTMPIIGGEMVIVSDNVMPDNTIFCGYGSMYLLAERAGVQMAQSEHVRFIEDQTVFKATARYDGRPVFGEAFVAIGLGAAPTMTATFALDKAN